MLESETSKATTTSGGSAMQTMKTPQTDHAQFDELCARVDDWEPLPAIAVAPVQPDASNDDEQEAAPIDGMILAGLVSP